MNQVPERAALADSAALDTAADLPDIEAAAPAGPNLEFDPDFGALERAAQGKPEQQYGGTIIPAESPNWKEVAAQATALLLRTHDLRVLVHLAVARLQLGGLGAFAAVLGLIRQQLEQHWEHVHPQLDPEDDNDPTLRANALLPLAEPVRVVRVLRLMPLAASRRDGPVSWRSIAVATGVMPPEDGEEPKTDTAIRAAFSETGAAALAGVSETIAACLRDAAAIAAVFESNSGYGTGPDLSRLTRQLQDLQGAIRHYMPAEAAAEPDTESPDEPAGGAEAEVASEAMPRRASGVSAAAITTVTNRADALRLLDLVCRYYQQYEPSSPLPLLIARARNLADKGFLEILQDLAPDGLMQAQVIVQSRES